MKFLIFYVKILQNETYTNRKLLNTKLLLIDLTNVKGKK